MAPGHLEFPGSQLPCSQHIRCLAKLQHLAPDHPGEGGPVAEGHSCRHPQKPFAAGQGDQDHQQNMRDPHHQVDPPGDTGVCPAPQHRRPGSHKKGDPGADTGGQEPDPDTEGQTCQRPGKHIPAHPVSAKKMAHGRGQVLAAKIRLHGSVFQKNPCYSHRCQQGNCQDQKYNGFLPAVFPLLSSHSLAAPLRILGSTTP